MADYLNTRLGESSFLASQVFWASQANTGKRAREGLLVLLSFSPSEQNCCERTRWIVEGAVAKSCSGLFPLLPLGYLSCSSKQAQSSHCVITLNADDSALHTVLDQILHFRASISPAEGQFWFSSFCY